jgi:adenosylhomocysteine nucleosidase
MMLRWLVSNWIRDAAQQKIHEAVAEAARGQHNPESDAEREPPPPCDVTIVFALGVESGGTVDLLQSRVTTRFQSHVEHAGFLGGRYAVMADSGVGRDAAAAATRDLIDLHAPPWIISAGFAGALHSDLRRGHILMADEVVDKTGNQLSIGLTVDRDHVAQSPSLHVGRLLTVDEIVRTKAAKQELGSEHTALACDMETLAIAEVCQQAKVRFMSVRIISDALEDELPREIETLVDQNTIAGKLGAATGAIFKRPSSVKDMWKLKEDALKASDRLAKFLSSVVDQL